MCWRSVGTSELGSCRVLGQSHLPAPLRGADVSGQHLGLWKRLIHEHGIPHNTASDQAEGGVWGEPTCMSAVRVLPITPNRVQGCQLRGGAVRIGAVLQAAVGALPETVPQDEVGAASPTLSSYDPPGDLG